MYSVGIWVDHVLGLMIEKQACLNFTMWFEIFCNGENFKSYDICVADTCANNLMCIRMFESQDTVSIAFKKFP